MENNNKKEDRRYYIYEHIRKDDNTCFYVGKGTGDRAYNLDRGDFHDKVRDKYGCRVEIIKDGLTEEEAFKLERERIEDYVITFGYGAPIEGYDDYDHNLPYLTNFTWGGEGASGCKRSEEEKRNISEKMKGKNPYANKTPEEMEEIKQKKKGEKNAMWGKPAPNRRKVICITTGKIFDCITDAGNYYKCSSIVPCCKGKYKHAGKLNGVPLQWKYLEDYNNDFKGILINPIIK